MNPQLPTLKKVVSGASPTSPPSALALNMELASSTRGGSPQADSLQPSAILTGTYATHNGGNHAHPSLTEDACYALFTGFRDDDAWEEPCCWVDSVADTSSTGAGQHASSAGPTHPNEQSFLEATALRHGLQPPPTPASPIHVIVARRGLTKKRLLAAHQHLPVVLPRWVTEGCVRRVLPPARTSGTVSAEQDAVSHRAGISDAFAVPWLHGYVFSTTGLTPQEREAIDAICVGQHGAELEPSLTYRCDALLVNAECVRRLQELLRRDATSRSGLRTTSAAAGGGADVSGRTAHKKSGPSVESGEAASWLTEKIRFALEFDIPVVDYVRLFSLLRLDRLPPPELDLLPSGMLEERGERSAATSRQKAAPPLPAWTRETEEALKGHDFDTAIDICRVGAPVGGPVRWRELLDSAARQHQAAQREWKGSSTSAAAAEAHDKVDEEEEEEEGRRHKRSASRDSSCTSPSSSSSSASTVSDPDAWEDFMIQALVPNLRHTNRDKESGRAVGSSSSAAASALPPPQRIEAYPPTNRVVSKQCEDRGLNTVDVDVHTAVQPETGTLRESAADYYSTATATLEHAEVAEGETCREPDSFHGSQTQGTALGMSQVDPSPRLTTNALLHRDSHPRYPPTVGGAERISTAATTTMSIAAALAASSTETEGREKEEKIIADGGDDFADRIAAYYAAQREAQRQQQQQQQGVVGYRVPTATPVLPLSVASCEVSAERETAVVTADAEGDTRAHSAAAEAQRDNAAHNATQVLVESCTAIAPTTSDAPAEGQTTYEAAAVSRCALPLFASRPPYLTVSLLGCSAAEEQRAVAWCGSCRFLRSPVPTAATDLVVLGSRLLTRKKYAAASHYAPMPAATHSLRAKKSSDVVSIRYWEMDAVVGRALAEQCGIPLSRLAPLRWLEDAFKATVAAAAATVVVGEGAVEEIKESASTAATAMNTVSSLQNTLAEMLEERVAAERAKADAAATGKDGAPLFFPFPALPVDELPSLSSPAYYMRLRHSTAATAAATRSATAVAAPPHESNTATEAATQNSSSLSNAKAAAASSRPQQHQEAGRAVTAAGGASAGTAKLPAMDGTAQHRSGASLAGSEAESVRSSTTTASTRPTATPHLQRAEGDQAGDGGKLNAYEAELETAGRRFSQLLTLLRVETADAGTGSRQGPGETAMKATAAAGDEDEEEKKVEDARRRVLAACCFCAVDGEFARVDWAVVRGLLKYGGGQVEKRRAGEWEKLLAKAVLKKKARKEGKASLQATPANCTQDPARKADDEEIRDECRLVAAMGRNLEYERQHRKLSRLMLRCEAGRSETEATASPAAAPRLSFTGHLVNASLSTLNGKGSADGDEEKDDPSKAVEKQREKVSRLGRGCQQTPVFCLLPHSFQRAPAAPDTNSSSSSSGASGRPATPNLSAPPSPLHALRGLPRVTQDYILACLAVGRCLSPHSFFLFHSSIPSAPDMRLFHVPRDKMQRQQQQQQQESVTSSRGWSDGAAVAPPPLKPQLSVWMREKRYSKPESVGVCVAFLWQLPQRQDKGIWVTRVRADATGVPARPSVQLVQPPQKAAAPVDMVVPSMRLVPLLRVLMLGCRNAVEAMGGHVEDTFSAAAVTHVVVIDLEAILSTSLMDSYVEASPPAAQQESLSSGAAAATLPDGGRAYWPTEDVANMVRTAAQHELSIVTTEWLARCVEWGTFVSEAEFPPPEDLQHRIQTHIATQQQRQQQRHTRVLTSRLSSQMSQRRAPSDGNAAELRKRHRTPSPPSQQEHQQHSSGTLPDPTRTTEQPHTPPRHHRRRDSFSSGGHGDAFPPTTRQPGMLSRSDPLPPHVSRFPGLPLAHAAPFANENDNSNSAGVHGHGHTPVTRRLLPPSASNSNSNVEPYTPPPRPPQQQSGRGGGGLPPPLPQRASATPSHRADSLSNSIRARSCRSHSGSAHRPRASPAASQHNTYSLSDQRDAEAYVEHLGSLFNFCSPGSTPLPSSARRGRPSASSLSSCHGADTERTPLPAEFREHILKELMAEKNDAPIAGGGVGDAGLGMPFTVRAEPNGPAAESATPPLSSQREPSTASVRCTPRRRTLRGTAAAASLSATARTPLQSPGGHSREAHSQHGQDVDSLLHDSQPLDVASKTVANSEKEAVGSNDERVGDGGRRGRGSSGVGAAAADRRAGMAAAVVVLGGGGSTLLSRRGTERRSEMKSLETSTADVNAARTPSPAPVVHETHAIRKASQSEGTAAEATDRAEEDEEVWCARSQASPNTDTMAKADDEEHPIVPTTDKPGESPTILCSFSNPNALLGEDDDETTIPLPCKNDEEKQAGKPLLGFAAPSTMSMTMMMEEVIPDSQPAWEAEKEEGEEGVFAEVLAPASFIEATAGAYAPLDLDGAPHGSECLRGRDVAEGERAGPCHVLGEEDPRSNAGGVATQDSCGDEERSKGKNNSDQADDQAPRAADSVVDAAAVLHSPQPRLGRSRSTARRPLSPSPVPQRPEAHGNDRHNDAAIVDVDAERSSPEADNRDGNNATAVPFSQTPPQQQPRHAQQQRDSTPAATHHPTTSPWSTHRPLSLSRRPSRSPVPPPPPPAASSSTAVGENTSVPQLSRKRGRVPAPASPGCASRADDGMRIYVLHDLPLRQTRVQRCEAAVRRLLGEYESPVTPTLHHPSTTVARAAPTKAPAAAAAAAAVARHVQPPVCFVQRCEDADVCVTHEVSLRESVLVALARGCWVVQPGFLECVCAIVDGCGAAPALQPSSVATPVAGETAAEEQSALAGTRLQLVPHTGVAAAGRAARWSDCLARLWEMCPRYEWTPTAADAASLSPMHRSLVLQCRRQHQGRLSALSTARRGGCSEGSSGATPGLRTVDKFGVFSSTTFVLLYGGTSTSSSAVSVGTRVQAIQRVLRAGGGVVVSAQCVGAARAHPPLLDGQNAEGSVQERAFLRRSPLRCCSAAAVGRREAGASREQVVSDEALYHDIVWLLCDALKQRRCSRRRGVQQPQEEERAGRRERSACNSPPPAHANAQESEDGGHDDSLVVLLDASLLEAPSAAAKDGGGGGDNALPTVCCVSLTAPTQEDSRIAAGHAGDERLAEERTREATAAGGRRGPSPQPPLQHLETLRSVGSWLQSWLGIAATAEGAGGYSASAAHALCSHLTACCSLAYHVAKQQSPPVELGLLTPAQAARLQESAEAAFAYTTRDLPFAAAPRLCDILSSLGASSDNKAAEATIEAAVAEMVRLWESKRERAVHCVEFRWTSWVGGCVAAGGAAAIASAAGVGGGGEVEHNAWMRECDAQTFLGAVRFP